MWTSEYCYKGREATLLHVKYPPSLYYMLLVLYSHFDWHVKYHPGCGFSQLHNYPDICICTMPFECHVMIEYCSICFSSSVHSNAARNLRLPEHIHTHLMILLHIQLHYTYSFNDSLENLPEHVDNSSGPGPVWA